MLTILVFTFGILRCQYFSLLRSPLYSVMVLSRKLSIMYDIKRSEAQSAEDRLISNIFGSLRLITYLKHITVHVFESVQMLRLTDLTWHCPICSPTVCCYLFIVKNEHRVEMEFLLS